MPVCPACTCLRQSNAHSVLSDVLRREPLGLFVDLVAGVDDDPDIDPNGAQSGSSTGLATVAQSSSNDSSAPASQQESTWEIVQKRTKEYIKQVWNFVIPPRPVLPLLIVDKGVVDGVLGRPIQGRQRKAGSAGAPPRYDMKDNLTNAGLLFRAAAEVDQPNGKQRQSMKGEGFFVGNCRNAQCRGKCWQDVAGARAEFDDLTATIECDHDFMMYLNAWRAHRKLLQYVCGMPHRLSELRSSIGRCGSDATR